jgi:hypothetical protein
LNRLSQQVTAPTVEELKLRDEFGRQSSVAIVDQRGSLTKTCQLALQSIDAVTERVSFSDKTLNCVRRFEEQTLNILDRVQLVDSSGLLGFAHHTELQLRFAG